MTEYGLLITLFFIGVTGAFFSGMLGLGGAIILVPMMLYIPPLLGVGILNMKQVAGITIVVVFASSLAGVLVHNKNRLVLKNLVLVMGVSAVVFSFIGAICSKTTSSGVLLAIFAVMSAFAAIILFFPKKEMDENIDLEKIEFNKIKAVIISSALGFIGGMVGAPGAYIFTPLMIYFLRIPVKVAIGSTLGIVLVSSVSGIAGKVLTGQVPFLLTASVVLGAVPAARLGAGFTKKIPAQTLRKALAVIIALTSIRMWIDVLTR
ncbi:sulfite exporter TauE/SafE family protein [Candidatus Magnetomonas plexicatena]|uniref:sulfite exporter TauE/SafE family protein n=1 Tax=Candidatus Magnetomonas plexicatena TaxID=2552947 RepID=UPI001101A5A4|nr:sulfite exporter TauE/SafE family protein [Nitrospirales bacterium LBB_01]